MSEKYNINYYADLIEKYGIKQKGKIHLIQVMMQKIKKMEASVPETITRQLEYLKT